MSNSFVRPFWLAAVFAMSLSLPAVAEEIKVEAVLSPKEQIRLDFQDGSKHFVLMVRREGQAAGSGPLAGARVVEHGFHDLVPGASGDPRGYLVFTAPNGEIAYVKWQVRAVFIPGEGGKPKLLDNGFWEIVGGTGSMKALRGAGVLHIKATSPTDRRFTLIGEIASRG